MWKDNMRSQTDVVENKTPTLSTQDSVLMQGMILPSIKKQITSYARTKAALNTHTIFFTDNRIRGNKQITYNVFQKENPRSSALGMINSFDG